MRPAESFIGQPIRSLQTMLRVIAEHDPSYLSVVPDGIYGTDTMNAVSRFQRNKGLPITGVADQDTWETIVEEYNPALIKITEAESLNIIFYYYCLLANRAHQIHLRLKIFKTEIVYQQHGTLLIILHRKFIRINLQITINTV